MSFFSGSRAIFPSSVGPTLLYSSPYTSGPFGWNSLAYGPSYGPVSAAWGRPRSLLLKRAFEELDREEQFLDDLSDFLEAFPPTKYSRYDDSSDDEDNMDVEDDGENGNEKCDCDDGQCDCGDECECDRDDNSEPSNPNDAAVEKAPSDSAAPSTEVTAPEKAESAISKPAGSSLFKSLFSDEQNFKVDETDDAVTVTSNWNGFNKGNLNVDFKNGALLVSGKSEVETKDEKSGAVSKSFKSVSKTIRLPANIDKEGIAAKFKDDSSVLTITVPKVKKPEKEVETIVIN
jgi:HSP20 family molecular chaperone IbpA